LCAGVCHGRNAKTAFLTPDATDLIQAIDHGSIGNLLKKYMNDERKRFLSSSLDAFDEWWAMSAKMKRIMYTWWVAMAWTRLLKRQTQPGVCTFADIFKQKGMTLKLDNSEVRCLVCRTARM
jgi:hypothetical protein